MQQEAFPSYEYTGQLLQEKQLISTPPSSINESKKSEINNQLGGTSRKLFHSRSCWRHPSSWYASTMARYVSWLDGYLDPYLAILETQEHLPISALKAGNMSNTDETRLQKLLHWSIQHSKLWKLFIRKATEKASTFIGKGK